MTTCKKLTNANSSSGLEPANVGSPGNSALTASPEAGAPKLDTYTNCNALPAYQRHLGFFSGTLRWFKDCNQEIANSNRGPVGWREEGIAAGEEAAANYQPDSPER